MITVDMCAADGKYWWMGDAGDAFSGDNGVQPNYQQNNNNNYQQTNVNNVQGTKIEMSTLFLSRV